MTGLRAIIIAAFLAVVATPWIAQRLTGQSAQRKADHAPGTPKLVIVTPHVEQIRTEFARGFSAWHQRNFGSPVHIDWRTPGGTAEIRKQLEAQITAAVRNGKCTIIPAPKMTKPGREKPVELEAIVTAQDADLPDLFLGGGSFEHGQIKSGLTLDITRDGKPVTVRARVSAPPSPAPFEKETLKELYGDNLIGVEPLYDEDQYWFGTALSAFGIVYNRELLAARKIPAPTSFADLGDVRYVGLLAMSDPRQSGSVATLYDSILNKEGWERGWRILREMSANARYFSAASTQPPQDVSQGESLAGVAIDFYGRGQAQSILRPGEKPGQGRVGYIDPPGGVYIDADPVSIVNGSRSPELAKKFVQFMLTEEGQALWQYTPKGQPGSENNPLIDASKPELGRLGPSEYRLRRLPVRRVMYDEKHLSLLTDQTDPFKLAAQSKPRGWRDAIAPLMGAFAIDTSHEMRTAWRAIIRARADKDFSPGTLSEMETLFFAMPTHELADGTKLELSEKNYDAIAKDTAKWKDPVRGTRAKIAYTEFFKANYERVIELGKGAKITN